MRPIVDNTPQIFLQFMACLLACFVGLAVFVGIPHTTYMNKCIPQIELERPGIHYEVAEKMCLQRR